MTRPFVTACLPGRPLANQNPLLDTSPELIFSLDSEGRFCTVPAAAKMVWGFAPEELVGRHLTDLVIPADHSRTLAMLQTVGAGASINGFPTRCRRRDGSDMPVLWSAWWNHKSGLICCVAKDPTCGKGEQKAETSVCEKVWRSYKQAKIGWWEWDAATNSFSVSEELYAIYGLAKESSPRLTLRFYLSLVHPADRGPLKKAIRQYKRQLFGQHEHRLRLLSGETIFVIHFVESIKDSDGRVVKVCGTTKNVTIRRMVAEKLRDSEQRLTRILESIDDGFFTMDKNWTVRYWNRKAEEVMQMKRENIVGKNLWLVYPNASTRKFRTEYEKALGENRPVRFEEYIPQARMWVEVCAYPSPEGLSIYFKDISQRKQQEKALLESNQRYAYVSKATSDTIWDWNLETGVLQWGDGYQAVFGHSPDLDSCDLQSRVMHIHPHDRGRVQKRLQQVLAGVSPNWVDEFRYRKADGAYAFVIDKGFVIRDAEGKAIRMVGALQDVSRQKAAEQSLKLSMEKFRLVFYQSPRPMLIFRAADWFIIDVNQAAIQLYGYSKEEFLDLRILDVKPENDWPELVALREQRIEKYHNIVRQLKKNGEVFYTDICTHAIDLPTGRHFIVSGDDMTDQLRLQRKLIEEKITAQKEVAKAILDTQEKERSEIGKELHDNVNQLLTTAKLYVENIHYFPERSGEFAKQGISLLQRAIDEIRFLSKQLVTPVMNDIGFEATIDELMSHYQSLHLFDIGLHYRICEKTLDKGLKLTIYRIIQEQLNNIVKYAKASEVKVAVEYGENELRVVISDNGIGFDCNKVSKGLGLKNMKNRADVYKGFVSIKTAPEAGTAIIVSFPMETIVA